MKINACNATIRMWKIDQPAPKIAPKIVPETPVAAHKPNSRKITSPAYILPNNRNECESGFETYSIRLNRKLAGHTHTLLPKGEQNNSCTQPPKPLTLIEKKIIKIHTDKAKANVVLMSEVGTARHLACSPPKNETMPATQSTGRKSIEFMANTHKNTVNAVGAMKLWRLPWKMFFT